jgi:pimeloyl-ACP methyl ester carboxylesterase
VIAFLWGEGGLPVRRVDSVETDGLDSRYTGLPSLAAIERLRIRMEFGLDSAAIHLRPERPNGTLVILHQGHDHQPLPMELSAALLERGYSVLAMSMPLYGENARPEIQFPSIGRLTLRIHEQLRLLEPAQGSQLKYFVEPVVVALNHLLPAHGYRRVAMIGLSGGGWTTTLAAAVDPRIAQSYPVAGSQPLNLTVGEAWPDFEQSEPTLYKRFSYLDLYLLGASGQGRRQVQVVNAYDPCCFRGRAAESYRGQVAERARRLGGDFDVLIDDTHEEHKISKWAMERILADLAR